MLLTVTHSDVVNAVLNSPSNGPLALAAQRAGLRDVRVGDQALTGIAPSGLPVRYLLSPAAVAFQRRLMYGDRYELPEIRVKRGKKGNVSGHSSVSFTLTADGAMSEGVAA